MLPSPYFVQIRLPAMRSLLTSFALVLAVPLVAPTASAQTTRTIDRSFELDREGRVELDTYAGQVDVTSSDQSRVEVTVRLEGSEEQVKATEIRFDAANDRLQVETERTDAGGVSLFGFDLFSSSDAPARTAYTVRMPRTATLDLDVYSADAQITSLEAPLRFDGYSGDLHANRIDGDLTTDTYSGDVRVDTLSGTATFDTYSGSGWFGMTELSGDSAFDSYSGNVTVQLRTSGGLVVETDEGAFDTELPVKTERDDDRIRATLSDGGPLYTFSTYSGTLKLERQ